MEYDPWFNILRTRPRQIEREERVRWSHQELREWAESVAADRKISGRNLTLPPFKRVEEICRELFGESAVE